jgi:hypothetical protein
MARDPIVRRRRTKIVFGVLAVGIAVSALVTLALIYLGQTPHRP